MNQAEVYNYNEHRYAAGNIVARDLSSRVSADGEDCILDVGCNKGYWGQYYLREMQAAKIFGLELDAVSAATAGEIYQKVYCVDLNDVDFSCLDFPLMRSILFLDVLEHLIDPSNLLQQVRPLLAAGGEIYVSLPNVAYLAIRLNLLFGKFDYTRSGILDRTHLHLYTKKSAVQLLAENGYRVNRVFYSGNYTGYLTSPLPALGPLLGYTIVLRAELYA